MIDLFGLTPGRFETFLLVLIRVTVMLSVLPVFSAAQIPRLTRVGIGMVITFAVFQGVHTIAPLANLYDLIAAVISQLVLGLIFGFVAQLVFMGIQLAGEILDIQIGFAVANVFNPMTQQSVTVIGELELALATLLFLVSDSHLLLLQGIGGSFNVLPLPYIQLDPSVAGNIVIFFTMATMIVFKIAAPAAIALFITTVALGLMARVAPQMNVFVVGFPLQIGIGLIMLAVSVPLLGFVAPELFREIPGQLNSVMRGMIPH
ncbi:MAG: flagellar biosynthetic protein FliR [Candidatus Eremiobacteraeota bacterium]|nr:flagellar biosynthetic protein FliR [Candidatus Eremiobacteraeota bacterium]